MLNLPQFAPIPTPRPAVGPRVAPAQANQDQISLRPPQPQQQPQGGAGGLGGLGGMFSGGQGSAASGGEKFGNVLQVLGLAMSNPSALPAYVEGIKQQRRDAEQASMTDAYLQRTAPDLVEAVKAGMPRGEAFKVAIDRQRQEAADQKRSEFLARYQTGGQTAEAGGGAGITQDGFDRLWAQYENDYAQAPDDLSREVIKMKMDRLKTEVGGQFTLSPGQTRYDAQGKPIVSGGPDNDAPPVQKLKLADGSEMAVQWNPETRNWDPIKAPSGGGDITPRTKLTESQSKLTLFQALQTETQPVLLDLESQWNPANITDAAARSTPIAGNFFKSEQGQMYESASTAWAEGALRIATGAAATPEEMERTKKAYFAQPGDTPTTVAFKAQMRNMYDRAIQKGLGVAPDGTLPKPSEFIKSFQGGGDGAANAPTAAPAAGSIEDGFRFKGGDPADPNNWERAQ